jgi:hypothetical protein
MTGRHESDAEHQHLQVGRQSTHKLCNVFGRHAKVGVGQPQRMQCLQIALIQRPWDFELLKGL